MKRDELKTIIRECMNELFEDNDYFMRMMSEAIKAAVGTTLKESLNHMPRQTVNESSVRQVPSAQSKKKGIIEKQGFDAASFFNEGGLDAVKEIFATGAKNEVEQEKTAHMAYLEKVNEKISDDMIFGSDFKQKMQKYVKR